MKQKIIKLAKEIGFVSNIIGKSVDAENTSKDFYYLWMCELQKYLRDKHNCLVEVRYHSHSDDDHEFFESKEEILFKIEVNYYGETFQKEQSDECDYSDNHFESYEKALEIGLLEGLKLIKN